MSALEKLADNLGQSEKIKSLLMNLGSNNKATNVVVAIAIAKGIFRPLITLSDKKEQKRTKQYAALREFLTELVAVPAYIAGDKIASKFAEKFFDPKKYKFAENNLQFIVLCLTTLVTIPALCSLVVKPFTNMIMGNNKNKPNDNNKKPEKLDIVLEDNIKPYNPVQKTYNMSYGRNVYTNNGLRVN